MASELQLAPRADSTQSTISVISLNRTTEKEGIIVDEGFCDLEDPSFGDAADRLAVLEKEVDKDEPSSPQTSRGTAASKRPPIKGASSRSLKSSSMRSSSSRSFGGITGSKNHQADSVDSSSQSQGALQSMDSNFSVSCGDSLPPGSPFGNPSFQNLEFHSPGMTGAVAKLESLGGVDDRLMSGLKSLSPDELNVYLKLTEELKKECQSLDGSPKVKPGTKSANGAVHAEGDQQLLEEAIRKLRALLPPSAIQQLEGHASYGLVDVVQATTPASPAAPPPTPASPIHRRPAA